MVYVEVHVCICGYPHPPVHVCQVAIPEPVQLKSLWTPIFANGVTAKDLSSGGSAAASVGLSKRAQNCSMHDAQDLSE